jgi:hypothetical protein
MVNGADVVPAGGGTSWALCGSGDRLASACTGSSGKPGADQYRLQAISRAGTAAESLSNAQQCDLAFAATGTSCSAARGATATETVALTGPQSTTNTATSYGTTVAYTVVAP